MPVVQGRVYVPWRVQNREAGQRVKRRGRRRVSLSRYIKRIGELAKSTLSLAKARKKKRRSEKKGLVPTCRPERA